MSAPLRIASADRFVPLPDQPGRVLHLPTERTDLHTAPDRYLARTVWNPLYGMPGWTRDCGRRFHRGCDVAATRFEPTGREVEVMMTDCRTGRDLPVRAEALRPLDEVCAVLDATVAYVDNEPEASTLGRCIVLRHSRPGPVFFTLYAHLDRIDVRTGDRVTGGQLLGRMGTTSASADARNWMALAPHLHFEAFDDQGRPFDPYRFLVRFTARRPA